jgi:PAS domain-containing protein
MQQYFKRHTMNQKPKRFHLIERLLPGAVLVCAIAIDLTGRLGFSVVPVACVFALVGFSFILPSRKMIGWTVIYILTIAATLWMRRDNWSGASGNAEALVATRALVAAAAGLLAWLLAKRREQVSITAEAIHRLLDQMKIPIITSDPDGWLVYMNSEASKLLGGDAALQRPFFDHFSAATAKGPAIRNYMALATGASTGPLSMNLALSPDRSQIRTATMLRVDIGERRLVMTLLDTEHSTPTPSQLILND